jgi:hypothetical protein
MSSTTSTRGRSKSKQSKQSKQPVLTTTVNGAKDLNEYIAQVNGMITQVQENFMREMADSEARCRKQRCRGSSHDFAMEMCGIAHAGLIYKETKLSQSSAFLQALAVANDCLDQLEALRKMLVNNKQQKRTAIRRLRELRNQFHQQLVLATDLELEIKSPNPNPTVKSVQQMIESTKQNHRTVSKGLIDQATKLIAAMRTRYILGVVNAAEDTAGAVLDHEKKCQAFMTQCLRLSAIEFCAKLWWFETQNQNHDKSKNYYIHAEVVHDYGDAVEGKPPTCLDHHFKASRAAAYFEFCAENRPAPRICITVHGDPDPAVGNNNPLICKYEFDQEFAETILTDEAIDQFEEARRA